MTNLPRRPIEPLAPAPDSFDRVYASARHRRRQKLVGASATMVLALVAVGSFVLASSLHVTDRLSPASSSTSTPSHPAQAAPQASQSPSSSKSPRPSGSPAATRGTAPVTWLHGRAVDARGHGIAGLYVQPGRPSQHTYSFAGWKGVRTDARGNFTIACPRAPVLLSSWRINRDYADDTAGTNWGATFVGSRSGAPVVPHCGVGTVTTTLTPGATVTGQLNAHGSCLPDDTYNVWLWLGGDHGKTIRLAAVHNGDTFSYLGLPAGNHTIGVRGQRTNVAVGAGAAVQANVDFNCDPTGGSTASPDTGTPPSAPPSEPAPSPSPTPSIG